MSVFIIAEIGSNHGGSLERALALIDAAADAGADAAKFQRFRVDKFLVPRENPEALRRYELPDEWLPSLKAACDGRGIEFMCTAFDLESLDVIDPYVKRHKVGSAEAKRRDYIDAVIAKGKPLLISNGMTANYWDTPQMTTLFCQSEYPADIKDYLAFAADVARSPEPLSAWGVSDHTLHPTTVPAAATALGACVVEKHLRGFDEFPPDYSSPDYSVSINPRDFREMVEAVRLTESAVRGA